MPNLPADQEKELTFLSGVNADGTVAAQSFWTWNQDTPATYNIVSNEAKWGARTAGTGATVTFAFDPASNWTAAEQNAFTTSMHLWSAVANVSFTQSTDTNANILITRGADGKADTAMAVDAHGIVGSSQLGTASHAVISIDTSVAGFGPLTNGFSLAGGYPWETALHELGHAIGLGHGGLYDVALSSAIKPYTAYDNTAWTIMSYIQGDDYHFIGKLNPGFANYGSSVDGAHAVPQTLGALDILAAERLYGMPVNSPLSGGQVFGFHSNIGGDLATYYDFSQNTHPIVTLWDAGGNNTLDVSGFTNAAAYIDLHQGAFSSVDGLSENIAIAYGTHIDTYVGTSGYDLVAGNDDGDVLMGGAGGDNITGGKGNDHIYGNLQSTVQGTTDGNDSIDAGDGSNYVNGNAGDDQISAGSGTNRLYGGAGNDEIIAHGHGDSHINGNTGDDFLQVYGGNSDIHGGQGNDTIGAFAGNATMFGDLGNDVLSGGTGINVMTGGGGADIFALGCYGATSGPTNYDEITDYTDGVDKFEVPSKSYTPVTPQIFHGDGRGFTDIASAEAYANQLLAGTFGASDTPGVAALQVGADTYLFFSFQNNPLDHVDSYAQVDHTDASSINQDDFVWSLAPLS